MIILIIFRNMLGQRQQKILENLIEDYINFGEPISSKLLAAEHPDGLSSATIRNELAELEEGGYIFQPHTSSGRVPTEKAYRFYVEIICQTIKPIQPNEKQKMCGVWQTEGQDITNRGVCKRLAMTVSEISEEAIFVAFDSQDVYFTGLSYLFQKPEFSNPTTVVSISRVLDHLSEAVQNLFQQKTEDKIAIFLGSQNPFGSDCATVVLRQNNIPLLGLFGPMRMPYRQHLSRMSFLYNLLNG